ncbi:tRNA (cytidine(34)-2'-O)-methyltransferase [Hirschia litorea]|uniref:tRNA (cytidine(34)-2'-O)-methyltransferase n=1 Tax=Hirschia litorea TaxID=1199156 RepID=A0ABW2IKJ9_9PROT
MQIAFYQPDIPQNLGSNLRIAACFSTKVDIIGPCGFPLTAKALRRSAMDYGPLVDVEQHDSWSAFKESPDRKKGRLILFTTKGATPLLETKFESGDTLLFGRESAGVPQEVHDSAQIRCVIPLNPEARSLNLSVSAAIALHEALRQTGGLPK